MKAQRMAGVMAASGAILVAGYAAAPTTHVVEEEVIADDPCADDASALECGETFDGPPVSNQRGTYQAQIVVLDGVVVDVKALEAGTSAPESVSVNAMAIPQFRERVLEAQSWDVEAVSGASYTSPAFTESLQGAFEAAGL